MKQQPLGICDHCLGPIPPGQWYTSKRKPRRYCSIECKNTANSRAGAPIRAEKMRERIRRGEWVNPVEIAGPPPPEEQARRARIGRLREVREGRWRNPGLGQYRLDQLSVGLPHVHAHQLNLIPQRQACQEFRHNGFLPVVQQLQDRAAFHIAEHSPVTASQLQFVNPQPLGSERNSLPSGWGLTIVLKSRQSRRLF